MRRPDESALEYLVRSAMASGVACIADKARDGRLDPTMPLDEVFGNYPKQWLEIRSDLVENMLDEAASKEFG